MNTAVVIPIFNEGARIQEVLREIQRVDPSLFIIVVDDGSRQNISEQIHFAATTGLVVRHEINLGKGASLKTGCDAAIRLGAERIVLMDGDGQHQPSDIPVLLTALDDPAVDIVFGSRKIGTDMPLMMMLGNKFLSIMTALLFRIYIPDTQSGFRAFRTRVYDRLRWDASRYDVETEIVVRTGQAGLVHREVEITTIYRDKHKGTTVIDGIKIFLNMLKWKIL